MLFGVWFSHHRHRINIDSQSYLNFCSGTHSCDVAASRRPNRWQTIQLTMYTWFLMWCNRLMCVPVRTQAHASPKYKYKCVTLTQLHHMRTLLRKFNHIDPTLETFNALPLEPHQRGKMVYVSIDRFIRWGFFRNIYNVQTRTHCNRNCASSTPTLESVQL